MPDDWGYWPPYVPVAERRARARLQVARLRKQGKRVEPIEIEGRTIASSFWGRGWCEHLHKFADFANRLERGRSYVRNGAVCHLEIAGDTVQALVMGSELYKVRITVAPLPKSRWQALCKACAGSIGSLVELLAGRLSEGVMQVVADRDEGLFPHPKEIRLSCSCPDMAKMCKHVAAVLYGVGSRLDTAPALLFELRGVDQAELIASGAGAVTSLATGQSTGGRRIAEDDLADVFGIEMAVDTTAATTTQIDAPASRGKPTRRPAARSRAAGRGRGKPGSAATPVTKNSRTTATKRGSRLPAAARPAPSPPRTTVTAPTGNDFSAADVAALRERLGLTRAELATLLGVSGAAVGVWERAGGPLNLHQRSRDALRKAMRLTPRGARRRLSSG